jgi:hypothetical protein
MLIEHAGMMAELGLAVEDMMGVWPHMEMLPRVSTLWKRIEAECNAEKDVQVYACHFGDNGSLVVRTHDGEIQVEIR